MSVFIDTLAQIVEQSVEAADATRADWLKAVEQVFPATEPGPVGPVADQPQTTPERTCDRHGGPWGSDETCPMCTNEDGGTRPLYGFFDFEVDESSDQIPGKHILEIARLEYDVHGQVTGGDEIAVIVHRTESGRFPIDGELAEAKRRDAQMIVDALNASGRSS